MKNYTCISALTGLCLLVTVGLAAQRNERHAPGQLLVSFQQDANPEETVRRFEGRTDFPLRVKRRIARMTNVWLLETDPSNSAEQRVLEWLFRQPEVRTAQLNHLLETRSVPPDATPNDPLFAQQWQHVNSGAGGGVPNADFDSDLAWNITTGGLSPLGDTIVVAVIDGGIEYQHEDIAPNMWRNYQEIPGDKIDNDHNGYVDDYLGWNEYSGTDAITGLATGHGTPVSSIICAKGNNGIGVAGINWDVKLMFVAGNDQESTILAAYDYVWNARKRYNASNGQQGAFVVAVNCSWGISFGKPEDAPLWCAAFDSLGAAGILGVAATANSAVDVDQVGDLPTTCPSAYQIAVTSLTKADQKASNAAWGSQSIDLGAYGKDVYTAGINNSYGTYSGTSFATPMVSGAVGLLYAAPCPNLAKMARVDPAAAARWAKDLILNTAEPNAALQGITVTGGRLNLNNLLEQYQNQCAACLAPFSLVLENITAVSASVRWAKLQEVQSVSLRWRKVGETAWNLVPAVSSPFTLSGLAGCTDYEISLRSSCGGASVGQWTTPLAFRTDACCVPPAAVSVGNITLHSALAQWNNLTASTGYRVLLRPQGGNWEAFFTATNSIAFSNLSACTIYELQIRTLCGADSAAFSPLFAFKTAGCGACTDLSYCTASSKSANDEWIGGIELGNWSHYASGGTGYLDFTAASTGIPEIYPHKAVPITLTPQFSGLSYKEYFRIFIDYNLDGDFLDPGEMAFDPGFASETALEDTLWPPDFSNYGLSRMRIAMKYKGPLDTPPGPCEAFEFGQVQDFCIYLRTAVGVQDPSSPGKVTVYPQPARDLVYAYWPGHAPEAAYLEVRDMTGRLMTDHRLLLQPDTTVALDVSNWPTGLYLATVWSGQRHWCQKIAVVR